MKVLFRYSLINNPCDGHVIKQTLLFEAIKLHQQDSEVENTYHLFVK